jgi:hypothetical protein
MADTERDETNTLAGEIRTLRGVISRLVDEEDDATKVAGGVARLSMAIVQALKLQRVIEGPPPDPTLAAIDRAWEQIDEERRRTG